MPNKLEQLKSMTVVVADTGEFDLVEQYQPEDATTNPSLILKASLLPQYSNLTENAKAWAKKQSSGNFTDNTIDKLSVDFGCELLQLIPGKVSTEVCLPMLRLF